MNTCSHFTHSNACLQNRDTVFRFAETQIPNMRALDAGARYWYIGPKGISVPSSPSPTPAIIPTISMAACPAAIVTISQSEEHHNIVRHTSAYHHLSDLHLRPFEWSSSVCQSSCFNNLPFVSGGGIWDVHVDLEAENHVSGYEAIDVL